MAPENMCFVAFRELPVGGEWMLSISLTLFAFATIIGWNVYGTCAVRYLWGEAGVRVVHVFRLSGSGAFHGACVGDIGSAEFPDGSAESALSVDAARRNCHRLWKRDR